MPSVCFYFQVHQPYRIKNYGFFDIGLDHQLFDEEKNRQILDKVSQKCYLPANALMLDLIKKHNGAFRIAYSISGVALEQFRDYRPDVMESFKKLLDTGCVELISETYYHSLSFLYSKSEFDRQVNQHREMLWEHFKVEPKVFRNTELIYNNEIAYHIAGLGYKGMIAEGVDRVLGNRSPNFLYHPHQRPDFPLLLKNYKLSDDIAFRFSNKGWKEHPLSAEKFAKWTHKVAGNGEVINLFMDYETFGEHQWEDSGIFEFMKHLPDKILKHGDFNFKTPTEVVETYQPRGEYDAHELTSWADMERDLSAWRANSMQHEALRRIYDLEATIKGLNDPSLLDDWSKLQTSDHFYYMSTKFWSDGDVHKYLSPYDSPYKAYINYMNACSDLEYRIEKVQQEQPALIAAPVVASAGM